MTPSWTSWVYLILGGSLGTLSRYGVMSLTATVMGTQFPYGTLVVNVLGCLLIGMLEGLSEAGLAGLPLPVRLALATGFLGALTTFSTFIHDNFVLAQQGQVSKVALNIGGSLVLGCIAIVLGYGLIKLCFKVAIS